MLLSHIVFLRSLRRMLVIANAVSSSPILATLMMEAIISSETLTSSYWSVSHCQTLWLRTKGASYKCKERRETKDNITFLEPHISDMDR
jgi:hypothetical protein